MGNMLILHITFKNAGYQKDEKLSKGSPFYSSVKTQYSIFVLKHLVTFPCEDVRVTFLLQASMVLSFFFSGSKKLPGSPLCRHLMKSALAALPTASALSTSVSTSMGTGAPEAREYSLSFSAIYQKSIVP